MSDDDAGRCGKPTKSGRPCRNPTGLTEGPYGACDIHADDEDWVRMSIHSAGWHAGFKSGLKAGEEAGRIHAKFEAAQAERAARQAAAFRLRDERGAQLVTVSIRGLTYRWPDQPDLQIGDTVVIPGNWLVKEQQECTVAGLGSDFEGYIQNIVRKGGLS